jgi:hypothetical protein
LRSLRFLCLRIFFRRHLTTLPTACSNRGIQNGAAWVPVRPTQVNASRPSASLCDEFTPPRDKLAHQHPANTAQHSIHEVSAREERQHWRTANSEPSPLQ